MSDKTHELLPRGTPALMRDVLKALPFDSTIDPATDDVRGLKWPNPPASFLPWLLREYSLTQFSKYVPDAATLYEQGRLLNQVKGTPKAVRIVAGWFGFNDIIIRTRGPGVHFAEFELGLDRLPDKPTDLCDLLDAIKRVIPLRSRFRRVWHGHDIGMFIPSHSPWSDLLGDVSGIHSKDISLCTSRHLCGNDLVISFRQTECEHAEEYEVTCEDIDTTTIQDFEHVRDYFDFPVLSQDFNGSFYPFGYGAIGEHETEECNSGYRFDGNVEAWNHDWINDPLPQENFALVAELDTETIVDAPGITTDDDEPELTDDGEEVLLG